MKRYFAVGLGMVCLYYTAHGALYNGNGDTSFGGTIGNGNLVLTDNGTTVSGTITKGDGNFADVLVIYIDSKTGGFNTTKNFTDSSTSLTRAISGVDASLANRATANFVSTFSADYAIALRPTSPGDGQLFQLVNNGALVPVSSVNLSPLNTVSSSTYTFSFNLADIGGLSFGIEATYISQTGFRSLESFESLSGFTGWDNVTFDTFHTYTLVPVPETTNASLAIFGGIALCGGGFARARRLFKKMKGTSEAN